jgi:hypothetical protein
LPLGVRDIEHRKARLREQKNHRQPTHPPIAVSEWMNVLESKVKFSRELDRVNLRAVPPYVPEPLEEGRPNLERRRWHVLTTSNPNLHAPNLPRDVRLRFLEQGEMPAKQVGEIERLGDRKQGSQQFGVGACLENIVKWPTSRNQFPFEQLTRVIQGKRRYFDSVRVVAELEDELFPFLFDQRFWRS